MSRKVNSMMPTIASLRRMGRAIPKTGTIVFGLLLILAVIALGLLAIWQGGRALAAQRRVSRASSIVQAADSVLIGLENIETGQRGYLITGDLSYLEPYHRGSVSIDQRIQRLGKLLPATAKNANLIADIRTLAAEKIAEIDQTIRVRSKQGFNAAANVVRTNVGKQFMDLLRAELSSIRTRYNRVAIYEHVLAQRRMR
ncbi:MAG: CHASE3 domain-containing protein, partial [Phycisphaerae bacterium]